MTDKKELNLEQKQKNRLAGTWLTKGKIFGLQLQNRKQTQLNY